MKNLVRFIILLIAALSTVSAQQTPKDPMNGTWELDVPASKFNPGPARKSDIRTYKVDGNSISMKGTVVFVNGKTFTAEFTGAFDGKDYPVNGNPRAETIAQVRVDAYTSKTTTKRNGKITATSTRQISQDGKTMTVTTAGTDENGVTFNNTLLFRKRATE
jgi:hypothetical protein